MVRYILHVLVIVLKVESHEGVVNDFTDLRNFGVVAACHYVHVCDIQCDHELVVNRLQVRTPVGTLWVGIRNIGDCQSEQQQQQPNCQEGKDRAAWLFHRRTTRKVLFPFHLLLLLLSVCVLINLGGCETERRALGEPAKTGTKAEKHALEASGQKSHQEMWTGTRGRSAVAAARHHNNEKYLCLLVPFSMTMTGE